MADPRDVFRNSDSVRVNQVSFYVITPALAPGFPFPIVSTNACVTKAVGAMDLVLNTQTDLGLFFNQNITLKAERPFPAGLPPRVKWNVDEPGLNIPIIPGTTLKGIRGSVNATFQEIPRSTGFACDNVTQRVVEVAFQTPDTTSELALFVDTPLIGDWKITSIQLVGGTAGHPSDLQLFDVNVGLRPQADSCRVWARAGQAVWFDAIISHLPVGADVTFDWTVPGGTGTGSSVLVTLPSGPVTITVTITATLLGQTARKTANLTFTTLSPEVADAIERACRLKHRAESYSSYSGLLPGSLNRVRGFVDPLWDEVPFFRTDGTAITKERLRQLLVATELLSVESASVRASLGRAISQERRTKASPVESQRRDVKVKGGSQPRIRRNT